MVPKDKDSSESTAGSPTLGGPANEDQNTMFLNTQDQALLMALQNLIVRVMNPTQENDSSQIYSGSEASKLITSLQEFISNVVLRSQPRAQNAFIDVSLDQEEKELLRNGLEEADLEEDAKDEFDSDDEDDEVSSKGGLSLNASSYELRDTAINNNLGYTLTSDKPPPTFKEKLLRALREHVFNKMPIRLLSFELNGSSFRISLLERGAIYERLSSMLEGKMEDEEFRSHWYFERIETDEEVIERLISKYALYAILSHTWLRTARGEVTYSDWNKGLFNSEDPGYQKLVNFGKTAWKHHRIAYGWMDTICINKESSSELDESIRSMYEWYRRAAVCITYLAETETIANIHLDLWFTRGWTLQELLAPKFIKFYNRHWKRLVGHSDNDKQDRHITQQIGRATKITRYELENIHEAPISRRMQLAATREVTREEDTAYSLMGIFNVSISTAYGEGAERAFFRLLQEILLSSDEVLETLNWAGVLPPSLPYSSRILPPSPQYYATCSSDENLELYLPPSEPLTFSHLGLRVPVILMPGMRNQDRTSRYHPVGHYSAAVTLDTSPVQKYDLLDSQSFGDDWKTHGDWYHITFAVFNFTAHQNVTSLRKTCIAIGLRCKEAPGEVSNAGGTSIVTIPTNEPIVFELSKITTVDANSDYQPDPNWYIKTDELKKHGMQLIGLYL